MISSSDVFRRVLSALNAAGIEYMIVGSLAASAHGFIRDTHDMDLVVVMSKESIEVLADRLGDDFYFDVAGAEEAMAAGDMFNIIHYETTAKIDFWALRPGEYGEVQFSRRRNGQIWGVSAFVETPEDTIISKLLWNRITPSDRQIGDVRGILNVSKESLDYDYLRKWAVRQGVWDELNKLLEEQ